jgi:hypothetical protein
MQTPRKKPNDATAGQNVEKNDKPAGRKSVRSSEMDLEVVNERLYRLETEVDAVKADLTDQKVAVGRLMEQVSSHEKRGEERHLQLLSALGEMKTDYRAVLKQQTEDAQSRQAFQNRLIIGILGLLSTVAGGIWGMSPSPVAVPKEAATEAQHAPAEKEP